MTGAMTLYPAIDLKAGCCVRLYQGRMDRADVYNEDPAAQARAFEKAGYSWVHIVDLDGAFAGQSKNGAAVAAVLSHTGLRAQLGGGLRDMDGVERWLERGLERVILGTAAVRDPDFVSAAARAFPGRVLVGVDAREDRVKTDGWAGDTRYTPLDIARRFEDAGVAGVVYTDIARDGALTGVNVEATAALADALAIPVIASGGVAGVEDIAGLAAAHFNIEGAIIGRALYDGRIDPREARRAAAR